MAGQGPPASHPSPVFLQMLDEAFELAKALAKNNPGWVYVPPFDDPLIWYVEPRVPWQGGVSTSYTTGWAPATIPLVTALCTAVVLVCLRQARQQVHTHVRHCPSPVATSECVSSDARGSAAGSPES